MSNFTVRRAEKKDIPKILDLLVQVKMVHYNGRPDLFKGGQTKYDEAQLLAIFADEKTPVFVCVDENDAVCGHAFCIFQQAPADHSVLTDIKTLYIDDICVDEKMRGHHIGDTLCSYVLDFAKQSGCYNVTLNVWACNEGAHRFYEKCGFVPQKFGMEMVL